MIGRKILATGLTLLSLAGIAGCGDSTTPGGGGTTDGGTTTTDTPGGGGGEART